LSLALVCAVASPLHALEEEITLGNETDRPWHQVGLQRLERVKGRRDLWDLVMTDASYTPDEQTQLLLHFDAPAKLDAARNYTNLGDSALLSTTRKVFGAGAAAFQPGSPRPDYEGPPLFGDADFTIELWLFPANAVDGERIFEWRAERWENGGHRPQRLSARLNGRTIQWRMEGLFYPDDGPLALQGVSPLVPRRWAHHMLRFESSTGLIEYLIDGVPEAVSYVTATGADGAPVRLPVSDTPGRVALGSSFTGLIDELRVVHRFVENPQLHRYGTRAGLATSDPIDLGFAGSRLLRIEGTATTPGRTAVELYYRTGDSPFTESTRQPWSPWREVDPSRPLGTEVRTRYVQLRAVLLPDGDFTPSLSDLTIVYEPDRPPPPPTLVTAQARDGSIEVSWRQVREDDVAGYLVYYGYQSGRYYGTDSLRGPSPVDAGTKTSLTLTGLENGRLYYIAVATKDSSYPAHQSVFSRELAVRPSSRMGASGTEGGAP
jgi:hypothetical protein